MHARLATLGALVAAFGFAGSPAGLAAQVTQDNPPQPTDTAAEQMPAQAMAQEPAPSDSTFLLKAISGHIMEVRLGELAEEQAQNQAVEEFGDQMVEDHREAYQQALALAQEKGWTPSDSMLPEHQTHVDQLRDLDAAAFDSSYVQLMLEDHQKDIEAYRSQIVDGQDLDVRRYATSVLPTLRDHLSLARETAQEIGLPVEQMAGADTAGADTTAYRAGERDTAGVTPDTGVIQTPDTGVMQPDTGVMQPDTGVMQPDTAGVTPDTAFAPDTAGITPDTAGVTPDADVYTPDTAGVTPDTGFAPATPDTATPDYAPDTGVMQDTTGDVSDTTGLLPDTGGMLPDTATVRTDTTTEPTNVTPQ